MEEFVKRLETLLDYYNINASSFADKIGVQRSSLSHLLSGRNKPSLDFIMKIIEEFPDVDLYWILQGKGAFPKNTEITNPIPKKENNQTERLPNEDIKQTQKPVTDLFNSIITNKENRSEPLCNTAQKDESVMIHKIIIFYKDGTFEDFKPRI